MLRNQICTVFPNEKPGLKDHNTDITMQLKSAEIERRGSNKDRTRSLHAEELLRQKTVGIGRQAGAIDAG
jgi:hypothetical protein